MKSFRKGLLTAVAMFAVILMLGIGALASDVVIVLDPGHGGSEKGATRGSYKEEVMNQKIANYLKAELQTYEGVKVYMTRTSVNQKMQYRDERVNIAKKKKATALVSLHNNSTAANSQTSMTGAFVCVPSEKKFKTASAVEARALAKSILKSLHDQVGLKNNGFWYDDELGILVYGQKSNWTASEASKFGTTKTVLNKKIPTMIVEHAFINNPNDRKKYLKTDAQLKKLGVADAAGIANYYHLKKKGQKSDTEKPEQEPEKPKYTGKVKIGSDYYLYDSKGKPRKGLVKVDGKYYYALEGGKLHSGWKQIGEDRYYFDKKTFAARIGWQEIGKNKYYFTSKGYVYRRWATINGVRYYFSKTAGILQTNRWLKYEGNYYYLNAKGTPYKSCTKKISGKKYKFNSKGICTNK